MLNTQPEICKCEAQHGVLSRIIKTNIEQFPSLNMRQLAMKNYQEKDCSTFYTVVNLGITAPMCMIGIAGNTVCLVMFYKYKSLGGSLLPLLIGLTRADLWYVILFSPVIVWPDVAFACCGGERIWTGLQYMKAYVWPFTGILISIIAWLIVAISIHRYIAVLHPLKHAQFSARKVIYRHLVLISTFSVVLEVPRFFEASVIEMNDEATNMTKKQHQYTELYYDHYYQLIYKNIIALTLKKYLPMVVISYCSVCIILSVKKRNKV